MKVWAGRFAVVLFVAATLLSVCDAFFSCGCRPWWASTAEHCNIHHAAPPHCPWCTGSPGRQAWVFGIIAVSTFLAMWAGRRFVPRHEALASFLFGVAGYLLGAVIASLLALWVTGYPTWLGFEV